MTASLYLNTFHSARLPLGNDIRAIRLKLNCTYIWGKIWQLLSKAAVFFFFNIYFFHDSIIHSYCKILRKYRIWRKHS